MLDFSKVGEKDPEVVDAEFFPEEQAKLMRDQPREVEVLPVDALNLPVARAKFDSYPAEVNRIFADAEALVVDSDETNTFAVALGGEAKKMVKAVELRRKTVTERAEDYVKTIKGLEKSLTGPLERAEQILKGKIKAYKDRQELARREAEKKAREAQAELQKKLDQEAKEKGVEPVQVAAPVIPKAEKVVRADTGTAAYTSKHWVCIVERPDDVPRQYCQPVQRLLNDAVKMGIREIPGCKIDEQEDVRFRT